MYPPPLWMWCGGGRWGLGGPCTRDTGSYIYMSMYMYYVLCTMYYVLCTMYYVIMIFMYIYPHLYFYTSGDRSDFEIQCVKLGLQRKSVWSDCP